VSYHYHLTPILNKALKIKGIDKDNLSSEGLSVGGILTQQIKEVA